MNWKKNWLIETQRLCDQINEVTKEPWVVKDSFEIEYQECYETHCDCTEIRSTDKYETCCIHVYGIETFTKMTGEFIAQARTRLPQAIERIKELEKELDTVSAKLELRNRNIDCASCKYSARSCSVWPCDDCLRFDKWEPKK